ncbi:defense protein l(2)34Fc-like [Cloeon dipterum]|uniref:defense protein l(2)34Fc-like n=1 Tax=Cloeon dipterum TaxID=197152 RepID=UPI00321FF724
MLMLAFVCALLCQGVLSFPTGAPEVACQDMTPQHGVEPQPEPSPYWAEITKKEERIFDFTIYGDETNNIEGFMIQARDRSTSQPLGTFDAVENEVKLINCLGGTGNCATHPSALVSITSVKVTWNAPEGDPLDNINFVYTVVKEGSEFWVNQIVPLEIAP